jgi:hypothetical protein
VGRKLRGECQASTCVIREVSRTWRSFPSHLFGEFCAAFARPHVLRARTGITAKTAAAASQQFHQYAPPGPMCRQPDIYAGLRMQCAHRHFQFGDTAGFPGLDELLVDPQDVQHVSLLGGQTITMRSQRSESGVGDRRQLHLGAFAKGSLIWGGLARENGALPASRKGSSLASPRSNGGQR